MRSDFLNFLINLQRWHLLRTFLKLTMRDRFCTFLKGHLKECFQVSATFIYRFHPAYALLPASENYTIRSHQQDQFFHTRHEAHKVGMSNEAESTADRNDVPVFWEKHSDTQAAMKCSGTQVVSARPALENVQHVPLSAALFARRSAYQFKACFCS